MSAFTKLIWFVNGLTEYTKSGFEKASKYFDNRDINIDMSNRAVMITGANSGIGKSTALELAKRGAMVYIVCRDFKKGESAQREIKAISRNSRVHLFIVDMSKPREVYLFARHFMQLNLPLNILVNNAGCMIHERTFVEGSLEINFATNTLGTHILTKTLLPLLAQSYKPRVIMVSSGGMLLQKLNPYDLNSNNTKKFDGEMVYAQNKRQQVVLTENYSKQYQNIYFASMHPGWVDTPAVQNSMPKFHKRLNKKLRTPEQGADTIVWLCCYPYLEHIQNGSFFLDREPVKKHMCSANTISNVQEEYIFMSQIERLYQIFSSV